MMAPWIGLLLPATLILARTSAMLLALPIFGSLNAPLRVRAGLALLLSIFFALLLPAPALGPVAWPVAVLLVGREVLTGVGLGLAIRLVYLFVQQAGQMAGRQLGFMDAGVIDPVSGERSRPLAMLFQTVFAVFFLMADGHHLLLRSLHASFRAFPVAQSPTVGALTATVLDAGSTMLLFALKLAAPLLAAFVILSVILGVLARVLPEMNILLASFPLRVGMGLFMAVQMIPLFGTCNDQLVRWIGGLVADLSGA